MRILIIGATGTIGQPVAAALQGKHDLVLASREKAGEHVDMSDVESIKSLFQRVGKVDAIVSVAGEAKFLPLDTLQDSDFDFSLKNKLMGQVNVVRYGFACVNDGGSITITAGSLARDPMPGSGAISLVNSGLEGFGRAAALEAPRKIRVNVVSPPWVTETLIQYKMDASHGMPAAQVAKAYVGVIEGKQTGQTITPA